MGKRLCYLDAFRVEKIPTFWRKHGEFWRISGSKAWWFQDTLVGERGIQLSGGCRRGDATAGDVEEQLHWSSFQWFYEISLQSSWITRWWVQGFSKNFGNFHWENLMTRSILTSITVDGQNPAPVGRVKTPDIITCIHGDLPFNWWAGFCLSVLSNWVAQPTETKNPLFARSETACCHCSRQRSQENFAAINKNMGPIILILAGRLGSMIWSKRMGSFAGIFTFFWMNILRRWSLFSLG